jgi:hypothetical protein
MLDSSVIGEEQLVVFKNFQMFLPLLVNVKKKAALHRKGIEIFIQ